MKLAVKIDQVATLRQARENREPDPVSAAVLAELSGADAIAVHLRQDRRHIQERDLKLLRTIVKTSLVMEMVPTMDMAKIALRIKPDICILVPESAEEITSRGGLDVHMFAEKIEEVSGNLKAAGMSVSVLVDADMEQIKAAHRLGIRLVQINTGPYADNWNNSYAVIELEKLRKAAAYARKLNMRIQAGRGLDFQNVSAIVPMDEIESISVGHALIANAVFMGLAESIRRMKQLINRRG
ncbi:MAG: pyridoxine 5'-phosphate synthase [Acidobacteriota bacterium]|jgi:pyridoxine 5-phosphate synthase|nr:pyridoxine 5'-phosphate synthase [Acidobacteriota bacterium]